MTSLIAVAVAAVLLIQSGTSSMAQSLGPLRDALYAGDSQSLRSALQAGADPNEKQGHLTPLMLAAARGQTEAVRLLLAHGAIVNIHDDVIGTTPLHLAAQSGNIEVARLLVEHGAHLNLQAPSHGFTALMNAVWHRHEHLVEYLLSLERINVDLTNGLGLKARDLIDLFMLGPTIPSEVREQHMREARRFHALFDAHAARRAVGVGAQTLMGIIADRQLGTAERFAAVRLELAAGGDVNAISPVMNSGHDAHTPILAAALFGQADVVEALLAAGADPTIGCGYMRANPAHKAASFGHTAVMRVLAAHPSFPTIRDARGPYNGYTPLMDAVWHGHFDAARILIDAGADLSVRGHDGKSARDLAREFGYAHIDAMLVMAEAQGSSK